MNIEIKTKNINNDQLLREFVARKVHFALDRIDERVDNVTVRLEDETKDSKRFDGLCTIEVELHPRGHIHVSSHGESAYDCVLQAIRKMEHATKHSIDRHRKSARIRHQQAKRNMPEVPLDVQLAETGQLEEN